MITIYTLSDPQTNEVFYVGQTRMGLQSRLKYHMRAEVTNKQLKWIFEYYNENRLQPIIEEIEICNRRERAIREEFWIHQFAAWGFNLYNIRHHKNKGYYKAKKDLRMRYLTPAQALVIDTLYKFGDNEALAKKLNCSNELVRLRLGSKRIPIWMYGELVSFYMKRAEEFTCKIIEMKQELQKDRTA
jgi:Uri superfamily endonuclease